MQISEIPMQKLTGKWVELVPLSLDHVEEVYQAGRFDDIWSHMFDRLRSLEDAKVYVERALENRARGAEFPFVNVDLATGRVVGSTRLFDFSESHRQVEIGHTWLTPAVWRTAINTESKYLLLQYCFERLDLVRVQLKTDGRNTRSQAALTRIGATREGVLRKHRVLPDGYIRDTVMYSVISEEWPTVRARLHGYLDGHKR